MYNFTYCLVMRFYCTFLDRLPSISEFNPMWVYVGKWSQTETEPNNKRKECNRVCVCVCVFAQFAYVWFAFSSSAPNFWHRISNCAAWIVSCWVFSKKNGFCQFIWMQFFSGEKILVEKSFFLNSVRLYMST